MKRKSRRELAFVSKQSFFFGEKRKLQACATCFESFLLLKLEDITYIEGRQLKCKSHS